MMKNPVMRDKLQAAKATNGSNNRTSFYQPMPSAMKWVGDGIDHININMSGETKLGQFLALETSAYWKHDVFGKFVSVTTFWHYIQSVEMDDRIRGMVGDRLDSFSKRLHRRKVLNFRAVILDACWQKIQAHPAQIQAIKDSTLPFDVYKVAQSGYRERPVYFGWLLHGFDEIRKAVKEDREPDFTFLKEDRRKALFVDILPEKKEEPVQPVQEAPSVQEEVIESQVFTLPDVYSLPDPAPEIGTLIHSESDLAETPAPIVEDEIV